MKPSQKIYKIAQSLREAGFFEFLKGGKWRTFEVIKTGPEYVLRLENTQNNYDWNSPGKFPPGKKITFKTYERDNGDFYIFNDGEKLETKSEEFKIFGEEILHKRPGFKS